MYYYPMSAVLSSRLWQVVVSCVEYGIALKEKTAQYWTKFLPYHVTHVWQVMDGRAVHISSSPMFHFLSSINPEGFYIIHYWYAPECATKYACLSTTRLCEALGIHSLRTWWAMSEEGKCRLLSNYYTENATRSHHTRIFSIHVDGHDATSVLKPYMDSITLDDNLTGEDVRALYYFVRNGDAKAMSVAAAQVDDGTVIITDYDLSERKCGKSEVLFPAISTALATAPTGNE